MGKKRNPIKQIMSAVHEDVRAGRVQLAGHDGYTAEVKRRIREAGLREEDLPELRGRGRHGRLGRPAAEVRVSGRAQLALPSTLWRR